MCSHFNLTKVESRDKLPQPVQVDPVSHCKEKDIDDCWFYFTYSVNGNNEAMVHVVETPGRSWEIEVLFLLRVIAGALTSETAWILTVWFMLGFFSSQSLK